MWWSTGVYGEAIVPCDERLDACSGLERADLWAEDKRRRAAAGLGTHTWLGRTRSTVVRRQRDRHSGPGRIATDRLRGIRVRRSRRSREWVPPPPFDLRTGALEAPLPVGHRSIQAVRSQPNMVVNPSTTVRQCVALQSERYGSRPIGACVSVAIRCKGRSGDTERAPPACVAAARSKPTSRS